MYVHCCAQYFCKIVMVVILLRYCWCFMRGSIEVDKRKKTFVSCACSLTMDVNKQRVPEHQLWQFLMVILVLKEKKEKLYFYLNDLDGCR